jgi:hypothetical protein
VGGRALTLTALALGKNKWGQTPFNPNKE